MKYVAVCGTLHKGYKTYGPWDTVEEAVDWAKSVEYLFGYVSIMEVLKPC